MKFTKFLPIAVIGASLSATSVASAATTALTLNNPGFENGLTGWLFDNFTITTSNVNTGSNAIQAGTQPDATAAQTIDLSAFATDIDAGLASAELNFFVDGNDSFDFYRASIEFFNGSSVSLGSTTMTGPTANTGGYVADSVSGAVPTGARSMEINLIGEIGTAGSSIGIAFDDVSSSLTVVPEPGIALLGALGSLLLLRRRRD